MIHPTSRWARIVCWDTYIYGKEKRTFVTVFNFFTFTITRLA